MSTASHQKIRACTWLYNFLPGSTMGSAANGLPRAVQLAGPLYRDVVLRAARTLEVAQPFAMLELG